MKTKNGVYRDWIEGKGLELVCKWAKLGFTDQQIIERMGIKERTFYVWQKKYPAFHKALKEAKTIPNLDIETSMIDLACGRAYTEEIRSTLDPKTGTIIKVEKVRKQIPRRIPVFISMYKTSPGKCLQHCLCSLFHKLPQSFVHFKIQLIPEDGHGQ